MDIDESYLDTITKAQYKLFYKSVLKENPYMKYKPYTKQSVPLIYCLEPEHDNHVHSLLLGGSGYGGKTFVGSMLAVQFLNEPDYTCLVTRRNYAELLDTNSIWSNLVDWCCNDTLDPDIRCEFVKSPSPKIVSPNGNTIYFKAFDHIKKKGKFKSTSYDRIINDEASELPEGILPFQYRSMRNTSRIPRAIINLSNPGGESTQYLVENFVDGDKPYLSLGWQDNTHINREAYHNSLKELDYEDYQYQAVGDWHYRVSVGDLINDVAIDNARVDISAGDYDISFTLLSVDLASTGKDLSVITYLGYDRKSKQIIILDSVSTQDAIADTLIFETCRRYKDSCNTLIIEKEPASSPHYVENYIKKELHNMGLRYNVHMKKVVRKKYERAKPLANALRTGRCLISNRMSNYEQFRYELSNLDPLGTMASPNYVDSCSLGFNWLDEYVLSKKKVRVMSL